MTTRLAVGDVAPPFSLPDADGRTVSLSDHAGRRVVLYAYPAAGTPGCTAQACDFQEALGDLDASGLTVLGLSPDPVPALAAFRDAHGLRFPLLSDVDRAVLTAYGAYGEKQLYGRTVTGVVRSTFVVEPDGRLATASYGVKATGHVARLLRDLGVPSGPARP